MQWLRRVWAKWWDNEEGITWQQIGTPPKDSQFLEVRTFQVQEIARMYGIPPHKLAEGRRKI